MSDLYEVGFTLKLKPDLSPEVRETLTYMTRSGSVSAKLPLLTHPFFHVEGFTTEWTYIISNPRDYDEDMLGATCGSVFIENQLTFRGVMHDDPFWNTWGDFSDWLFSISSSTGLIGYYKNLDDEKTTLVSFQKGSVCELEFDNYAEFEDLQNLIIENLENSEFEAPVIQEAQVDSSVPSLGKLAKAKGYLIMRVPGLGIVELLRPSPTNPGQMISVARSTSEDEIRQAIEQEQ